MPKCHASPLLLAFLVAGPLLAQPVEPVLSLREVIQASGVEGGLVVHLACETLFVAGPPDVLDEVVSWRRPNDPAIRASQLDQAAAGRGERGGHLWAVSTKDGSRLASVALPAPPVFDGLIAADGKLFVSLTNGQVVCFGEANTPASQ